MLCLSPTLLSLELVPAAVSGGADGRQAHISALLVRIPELFQLIQGTGIYSYALFLHPVLQDLTMVAGSGNDPDCILATLMCGFRGVGLFVCFFLPWQLVFFICQLTTVTRPFSVLLS